MYKFIRKFLFLLSPEAAHKLVFFFLRLPFVPQLISLFCKFESPDLRVKVGDLEFPNPVGLAAGMDKDAEVVRAIGAIGFGFIEVGTVTPLPQPGNPKPRLFRLVKDKALINRMGFNNTGVQQMKKRLKQLQKRSYLLGVNIGKNKFTPNDKAVDDYVYCLRELHPYCDFFVVNVSSPNTPGLRNLQNKSELEKIFTALNRENEKFTKPKPIFLKIAPDLTDEQLKDIVSVVKEQNLAGIIATNTTIERKGLSDKRAGETGGLSGAPLAKKSTDVIRKISSLSQESISIIGAGGIFSAQDAIEKLESGAFAVELFTGFIYEGPCLVKKIKKGLLEYFKKKV